MMGGVSARRPPLLLLLLLLCAAGVSAAQESPWVRVLLAHSDAVMVTFEGPHAGALDGRPFATRLPLAWPVAVAGERELVDGIEVG